MLKTSTKSFLRTITGKGKDKTMPKEYNIRKTFTNTTLDPSVTSTEHELGSLDSMRKKHAYKQC
jgi:hypothetical protein